MNRRNRQAALRAVKAAADDAEGKLGIADELSPELPAEPTPEPAPEPALVAVESAPAEPVKTPSEDRTAFESKVETAPKVPPAKGGNGRAGTNGTSHRNGTNGTPNGAKPAPKAGSDHALEGLLPDDWRERVDLAQEAEAVVVGGERVRRRVDESTVYLAVRVPRSLRDAVRRRAERLDVSMQDFVVRAAELLLEATSRAAEPEA